jgi:cytochrome c556
MRIRLVLLVSVLILAGCEDLAPVDGKRKIKSTAEKLKPITDNTFDQLMGKSAHNLNYILYGLLNYDEVKIKRGTDNIITICRLMMQKLPDDVISDPEEKDKWGKVYQEQSLIAENLNFRFEELKYDDARAELANLMKNCMLCHKEITGISKAELTFYGERNPNMEMALTKIMDSNNLNFDDALFGLVAHDLEELDTALENMKRAASLMMAKIPSQYEAQKEKWDSYCKDQRQAVIKLGENVKAEKDEEIWLSVQDLLKSCMDCHKLYKPGIK